MSLLQDKCKSPRGILKDDAMHTATYCTSLQHTATQVVSSALSLMTDDADSPLALLKMLTHCNTLQHTKIGNSESYWKTRIQVPPQVGVRKDNVKRHDRSAMFKFRAKRRQKLN